MYQPRHVANALLERAELTGLAMSQMRLQKMLYFFHGCYSVWHDEPLLPEVFEVWQYGPAIDTILREYTEGDPCICERYVANSTYKLTPPKSDTKFWSSLDTVWSYFSKYDDHQLSNMAHCEGSPWAEMMKRKMLNHTIPQHMIIEYFKTITSQPNKVIKKEDNVVHVEFGPK